MPNQFPGRKPARMLGLALGGMLIISTDLEAMTKLWKPPWEASQKHQDQEFRRQIEESLRKKGHYFAQVSLQEKIIGGKGQSIFNIVPGPVVQVRNIRFTGNKKLPLKDLARQTEIIPGSNLQRFQVDAAVKKLETLYRIRGLLGTQVTRELIFSADFIQVEIVYHIREGRKK